MREAERQRGREAERQRGRERGERGKRRFLEEKEDLGTCFVRRVESVNEDEGSGGEEERMANICF